jgi:hypothetical protein
MPQPDHCRQLAREIAAWLARGIRPQPDVRHYIDSTFALPTHQELESVLKDPDNCERDTLLELIFFPGQDIQIQWEDLIEQSNFQRDDEEKILDLLMGKKPEAALYYPPDGPPVCFAVSGHAAGQLIARLNIHKHINSKVLAAIRQHLPLDGQKAARVMIRNAGFACQGAKAAFLETFMGSIPPVTDDFFEHLEFVLDILETCPDNTPLAESLALRKQHHQKSITKAEQFERQRLNRNMETMIMQGIRTPLFDPQKDMQKIAMIDTVSLAIYGKIL